MSNLFPTIGLPEILSFKPTNSFLVQGFLPASGMAVLYGHRAAGKSALIQDLCATLLTGGTTFHGLPVQKPGPHRIAYLCLEGSADARLRLQSMVNDKFENIAEGCDLQIFTAPLDLSSERSVDEYFTNVEAVMPEPTIVVVDTFVRALGRLNENSSNDTSFAFNQFARFEQQGALVIYITHATKTSKGAASTVRGSTAIGAAADCEILVSGNGDDGRIATVTKMKSGSRDTQISFKLEEYRDPKWDAGITSIVVRGEEK